MGVLNLYGNKVKLRPSQKQFYNTPQGEQPVSQSIRVQILRSTSFAAAGTTTIYTVPPRKRLFITAAFIANVNPGSGTAVLQVDDGGTFRSIMMGASNTDGSELSNSFLTPIIVEAGRTIQVVSDSAANQGEAGFAAYEETATPL